MLNTFVKAMTGGLLAALTVVALQVSFALTQLSEMARASQQELADTARAARETLIYSQAVLASIRGTTETVRHSAVEQMGYYEAAGRRSAAALARLELLITHADSRLERVTGSLEQTSSRAGETLTRFGELASSVDDHLDELSGKGGNLMDQTAAAAAQVNRRLADSRLDQMAAELARASQSTAQATANAAEATGYVRDMLSPTRKSFWRRLLELLIPRPTVRVP